MIYRLAAEGILLLHFAFIIFAVAGAWLALRWPWLLALQLPACAWAVWVMASGRICPLTPLENHFRRLAGEQGYAGGFIEHYLLALIYPEGLTRGVQVTLGAAALFANAAAWWVLWHRWRSHQRMGDLKA